MRRAVCQVERNGQYLPRRSAIGWRGELSRRRAGEREADTPSFLAQRRRALPADSGRSYQPERGVVLLRVHVRVIVIHRGVEPDE
jgi:hypothetical protein